MTQEQIPPNRAIELIDPELIRRLEAYVRSQRAGPRRIGLHTSDLVSGTVHRLIVQPGKHGNTLEYQDLRRLAYTVARGVVIDAKRRLARILGRTPSIDFADPPAAASPLRTTEDKKTNEALTNALRCLSREDHRLIVMRVRGATWDQVGASCDISAETARKRWQRVIARLRCQLPTP